MSSECYISISVDGADNSKLQAALGEAGVIERAELHEAGAYLSDLPTSQIEDVMASIAEQKIKADGSIDYDDVSTKLEHFIFTETESGEFQVEYMKNTDYAANAVYGILHNLLEGGADLEAIKAHVTQNFKPNFSE